jgi:transitional endoplasmic reticulum ATPase
MSTETGVNLLLRDLRKALLKLVQFGELSAWMISFFAVPGLGAAWAVTVVLSQVSGRPLLYEFNWASSPETFFVLGILTLFVCNVAYALTKFAIVREGYRPILVDVMAVPVFLVSLVALLLWLWSGPAPKAHQWPLTSLVIFTAWAVYEHRYGRLADLPSPTRERTAMAPAASPESGEAIADVAHSSRPKTNFTSIAGNDAIKARLKEASSEIIARSAGAAPRNGILLHGGPGNGKTVLAEALAGEFKVALVSFGYSEVASQWVGEKTARVRQAFAQAIRAQPCVLFIDEIDSFLEARDGRGDGVKEDRDMVNAMLTLMVEIRKHRVILVGATNHMDKLDSAAVREGRFDFKIEITPPDLPARIGLLQKGLRENVPDIPVDEGVVQLVAQRWNGFSVKRILAVTEELRPYVKSNGLTAVRFEDFMGALRQLQGQRGAAPENVKKLAELLLTPDTRESLDLISGRMADPEHTERHGGTLPTGVLFSGPPGTGKTATCKALAAELGWAFLPATGADLAREPKKLEALYAKAQDLRPAVIFIDEGDELLRSRDFSPSTEATNKLLTLMDGVGDRVRDVVWIAATNHPEQIDSALLRGGRFTEKVRFELPTSDLIGGFVEGWLGKRQVQLEDGLLSSSIAKLLDGLSIANIEAILQAALNRAIARRTTPVLIGVADLEQARRTVDAVA